MIIRQSHLSLSKFSIIINVALQILMYSRSTQQEFWRRVGCPDRNCDLWKKIIWISWKRPYAILPQHLAMVVLWPGKPHPSLVLVKTYPTIKASFRVTLFITTFLISLSLCSCLLFSIPLKVLWVLYFSAVLTTVWVLFWSSLWQVYELFEEEIRVCWI